MKRTDDQKIELCILFLCREGSVRDFTTTNKVSSESLYKWIDHYKVLMPVDPKKPITFVKDGKKFVYNKPVKIPEGKKQNKTKTKTKQTIINGEGTISYPAVSNPLVSYKSLIFLCELWSTLEKKRLVRKGIREQFLKIILNLNNKAGVPV